MAPVLAKSLGRLSRESLINLVSEWLQQNPPPAPYLVDNRKPFEADEEDYLHTPADSIDALRGLYRDLQRDSTRATKRAVIDRIVDGDWRRGLSLHQHATIDFAYLQENDTAVRWSALRLVSLDSEDSILSDDSAMQPPTKKRKLRGIEEPRYPQIPAQSFLAALKTEISPLVKAHYHLYRMPAHNLDIIRLYIMPSAAFGARGSTIPRRAKHATDAGRVMFIALPDSCPYVYVSLSGALGSNTRAKGPRDSKGRVMAKVDMAAMKKIVLEAIPKALSRPQQRWAIESTKLNARSLRGICELRGNQKPGSCGGAYSGFAGDDQVFNRSPLEVQRATEQIERQDAIERRFGRMTGEHHAALDRVQVKLENVMKSNEHQDLDLAGQGAADIGLTFTGSDVFLGLKRLAEVGSEYLDLDKMPAWMTGELGMSSLTAPPVLDTRCQQA